MWLIALASYEPTDPVWFFSTGTADAPANFVGRVGAFIAELSFQLFGYAAYVVPVIIGLAGWHYFWCQTLDAVYTKASGVVLFFASVSALLSLVFGAAGADPREHDADAGGWIGAWLGGVL